jgi:transglutaminase-like putative cysteine protease
LLLFSALIAGCLGFAANKENADSNLSTDNLLDLVDVKNLTNPQKNSSQSDEVRKGIDIEKIENIPGSLSPISSKIPDVPTYPEEKLNIIYPKEYRLLSMNFQRAIGASDEKVASEVFNITGKTSGYNAKDACDAFDYVNRHWVYRYDKNAEFFFGASQTINEGYKGDCDDYSIVICTILKNMGFNARIVTVKNENYGHAYPELYIGGDEETAYKILNYIRGRYSYAEEIWYSGREMKEGEVQYWLNFDWSGSNGYRHPGGVYFKGVQVLYYPNGLVEF